MSNPITSTEKKRSFERFLKVRFAMILLLVALLSGAIIWLTELDFLGGLTLMGLALLITVYAVLSSYAGTLDLVKRFGLQLEALSNEEHNTWHLAGFNSGIVADLRRDNDSLNHKMLYARDAIIQQESVLLSVIEQLVIPVVVIDGHGRVYSANRSFQSLISEHVCLRSASSQPDISQSIFAGPGAIVGAYASDLQLQKQDGKWSFSRGSRLTSDFRLYENHIFRGTRKLDILLCFSVEQTLRDNEKQVWQKLLRVLNHEVRNSLTPISSIAQSLQQMLLEQQSATRDANDRTVELLQVIEKRAQHLLGFVEAYSAFKHIQKPNKQYIEPQKLAISLKALDSRVQVKIEEEAPIFADEGHLQQTLINVIKNASEADSEGNPVEIIISADAQHHIIRVLDCGQGIINPDNLFVPFYSTKQEGNGIGLILSRELMRQQGGDLTLFSRKDAQGAEAKLLLPKA